MMKHFVLCILLILLLNGCSTDVGIVDNQVPDTTEMPAPLDMDQSVYFSVVTQDGFSAMSLSRMIYEQPEIYENVAFEYMVYTDEIRFDEVLSKEESDFVCVPFEKGMDILLSTNGYVLYAVMENRLLEDSTLVMALLTKQATLNIYPEVVATFFRTYEKATIWSNDNPERLMFYLEQLEIESEIMHLTYKRAGSIQEQIIRTLEQMGKSDDERTSITKAIFKP